MPERDDVIPGVTGDDGESAEPREVVESEVAEQEGDQTAEEVESEEESPEGEEEVEETEEGEEEPEEGEEESESEEEEGEAEPEPAPAPRRRSREAELSARLKEFEPYAPLLDVLKEDPNLVREIVAKKLGLAPQAPTQAEPTQQGRQMTSEELNAAWNKRLTENPAQAINDLIAANLERVSGPQQKATVATVIRGYKADRRADDELFSRYENYFDALVSRADPRLIMQNAEQALSAIEATALGIFAREQRAKVRKTNKTTRQAVREEPRRGALAASRGTPKAAGQAKAPRKLSAEEQILADRYGADAIDTSDDSESAWG